MSGIAGLFGGNSAKTDRSNELAYRNAGVNLFDYALPEAQKTQAQGSSLSNQAGDYFGRLLRAGRSDVAKEAAPAINSELSAEDAQKRREAITGTGRTGGTAEADRMAHATSEGKVADIINNTDQQNKAVAAQGAAQVGSDLSSKALGMLGLSSSQINALINEAGTSRKTSQALHDSSFDRAGEDVGNFLANAFL